MASMIVFTFSFFQRKGESVRMGRIQRIAKWVRMMDILLIVVVVLSEASSTKVVVLRLCLYLVPLRKNGLRRCRNAAMILA